MSKFMLAAASALAIAAAPAQARPAARPARIAGHPNFNGIWQAISTAHWNLEDHSASATPIWQLGALYAVPAGQSVVEGGSIPYTPAALKRSKPKSPNSAEIAESMLSTPMVVIIM